MIVGKLERKEKEDDEGDDVAREGELAFYLKWYLANLVTTKFYEIGLTNLGHKLIFKTCLN